MADLWKKKQEAKAQSVIIEDQSKGRPATKHLKAFTKKNNKAVASNTKHTNSSNEEKEIEVLGVYRCHLCHEPGHYAS
ncbi:11981_t:CDS:2, partial [Cetraspora pellucida]